MRTPGWEQLVKVTDRHELGSSDGAGFSDPSLEGSEQRNANLLDGVTYVSLFFLYKPHNITYKDIFNTIFMIVYYT